MRGYLGRGMLAGYWLVRSPVEGGPLLIPDPCPSPAQGRAANLFLQEGFLIVGSLSWMGRPFKTRFCSGLEHWLWEWTRRGSLTSVATDKL